jgi:hypothetical protein
VAIPIDLGAAVKTGLSAAERVQSLLVDMTQEIRNIAGPRIFRRFAIHWRLMGVCRRISRMLESKFSTSRELICIRLVTAEEKPTAFVNWGKSLANHCASQMPNDSAQSRHK